MLLSLHTLWHPPVLTCCHSCRTKLTFINNAGTPTMRARRRFSILQQSHSSCATSTKTDDYRLMSSLSWSTLVQISNGSRHWLARQWTILGLIMLDSCKSLWEQRGWQETTSCKGSCVLMPMQKPSILLKLLQSLQRLPRQQQPKEEAARKLQADEASRCQINNAMQPGPAASKKQTQPSEQAASCLGLQPRAQPACNSPTFRGHQLLAWGPSGLGCGYPVAGAGPAAQATACGPNCRGLGGGGPGACARVAGHRLHARLGRWQG